MTATVVGSGPNGLSAAVVLARAGHGVTVYEAAPELGGGTRSGELTLPGYTHDVCSAVHPMGAGSPFFSSLPLAEYGLEWVHPPVLVAHPFDDGTAAVLLRDVDETAADLGRDGGAYRKLVAPLAHSWKQVMRTALRPPLSVPPHPLLMARLGLRGLRSATGLARRWFRTERARAFFLGIAAHSVLPVTRSPSAAFGVMLAVAGHGAGWPFARGGSRSIGWALAAVLRSHGGRIVTGHRVDDVDALPASDAVLMDLTPRQVVRVAGHRLPDRYRRRLERYRYGPGVFKIDWALSEPIPWAADGCRRAGTVHLGSSSEEIAAAMEAPWNGKVPDRPFVLLAQPSRFDDSRAPEGRHTAWAYCHVPAGSKADRTRAVEDQVERFAPGFRDTILGRSTKTTADMEAHNPNLVGGDINGGVQDLRQFLFRPVPRLDPYRTPVDGLYICSASTPPGGGVHGMCGYHAARSALKRLEA